MRVAYSVTVGIFAQNHFILLLKSYFTKVLAIEYKSDSNKRIKFVCIDMCSLAMSLHLRDLPISNYYTM